MLTSSSARRQPHGHRAADRRHRRKASPCQRSNVFYISIIIFFLCIIAMFTHLLNKMPSVSLKDSSSMGRPPARRRPPPGSMVRFRPSDLMRRLEEKGRRLDRLRSEGRVGIRPPRLALVSDSLSDPSSLFF